MEISKFKMRASAPSRHYIEKFRDILTYRDPDFFLYHVNNARFSEVREESGRYVIDIEGWTEYSCNVLFGNATPYDNEGNPAWNAQMTNIPDICRKTGIEVVCDAVNETVGFTEHYEADRTGLTRRRVERIPPATPERPSPQ